MPVPLSLAVAILPSVLIPKPRPANFHAHYNLRHRGAPCFGRPGRGDSGGPGPRPPARDLPLPPGHAHAGGAAGRPLPPKQGHRRPVPLARPGRRIGRLGLRLGAREEPRHSLAPDSQFGIDARHGRPAHRNPAPVHGQSPKPHTRARDERPFQRPGSGLPRPDLASGRHGGRYGGGRTPAPKAPPSPPGGRLPVRPAPPPPTAPPATHTSPPAN